MISDIYNHTHTMEYILSEVERIGAFCGLSSSDTGKLRLLAEEMMGLTVRLFDNLAYEFSTENEGHLFTLRLSAKTLVNLEQKDKMLSLSSDGRNAARKGILGKISGVFQDMLMSPCDPGGELLLSAGGMGGAMGYHMSESFMYFSLSEYRVALTDDVREDQWDGLEKSIIANIAKDMTIGVKNNRVEMTAVIDFS